MSRKPIRKTDSLYSVSTVNIEFPGQFPKNSDFNKNDFQQKSIKQVILEKVPKKYPKERVCEEYKNEVICQKVELVPPLRTDHIETCVKIRNKRDEKCKRRKLFHETFCKKKEKYSLDSGPSTETPPPVIKSKPPPPPKKRPQTSKELYDEGHVMSMKQNLGEKWKPPCKRSNFSDLYNTKFIGVCGLDKRKQIYPDHEIRPQYHFTLTENSRKVTCLDNPNYHQEDHSLNEQVIMIKNYVKLAENVEITPSVSQHTISVCEEIDLDNPFNLDYQGIDYKENYVNDEQDIQNVKEYLKIKRYLDKSDLKAEIANIAAIEELRDKVRIPDVFNTNYEYKPTGEKLVLHDEGGGKAKLVLNKEKRAELFRTVDKPLNKQIIETEDWNRKERYRLLFQEYIDVQRAKEKEMKRQAKEEIKYKAVSLAKADFKKIFMDKDEQKLLELKLAPPKEKPVFPHTMEEVLRFQHKMKKSKKTIKEEAKFRQEFFRQQGFKRNIREAEYKLGDVSATPPSISEQSTDDADEYHVRQEADKYYLRGFQFKLGENIRGRLHQKQKKGGRKIRGCMTRTDWIDSMAPSKVRKEMAYIAPPIIPAGQHPDDPQLSLFPTRMPDIKAAKARPSAIRTTRNKPFGEQYKKPPDIRVNIKIPKKTKVKKFNLTGFMYGAVKRIDGGGNSAEDKPLDHLIDLPEYIRIIDKIKMKKKLKKRRQRMRYMGIPLDAQAKEKAKEICENVYSDADPDWIPSDEQELEGDSRKSEKFDLKGSMPAPNFREPTLRRHPRHPRDPVEVSEETLYRILDKSDKPYLTPPEEDRLMQPDLDGESRPFLKMFHGRSHHEHWDPTQHKTLRVKYVPHYPEIKPAEVDPPKKAKKKKGFEKAIPPRIELRDVDLSLPGPKVIEICDEQIEQFQKTSRKSRKTFVARKSTFPVKEEFHSRKEPLEEFPGREKFLQLIRDMKAEIKRQKQEQTTTVSENEGEQVDENLVNEIERELDSIKSCVSSLDSSTCTNFTNDSGSFIFIDNKKVPIDYIRRSMVPFEEINRTRLKAVPYKKKSVYEDPFATLPFAGQSLEYKMEPIDKFHTFATRNANDIRGRLLIPTVHIFKRLIGPSEKEKSKPQVANDVDEIYIKELKNRPPFKIFDRHSVSSVVKEALRKKYITWCIQQKTVELKTAQEKEVSYYDSIMQMKRLMDKLFLYWEQKFYTGSMKVLHKIKPMYEETNALKEEMDDLEKKKIRLNLNIVFIENDWARRTIFQNFHYLIAQMNWREENDWIHMKEDNTLETYQESIENRYSTNIRDRTKGDAWDIKDFYENTYLTNLHPIIIVHPNADSFFRSVEQLKSKTFVCLLELHFTMWVLINLEKTYQQFQEWSIEYLEAQSKFVLTKCSKKYFLEKREKDLEEKTRVLLEGPLKEAITSPRTRHLKAVVDVVYCKTVPDVIRSAVEDNVDIQTQLSLIWECLLEVLSDLNGIPREILTPTENSYRKRMIYKLRTSQTAVQIEKRIQLSMIEVKKNLLPPFVKPKRTGKLQRTYLKKKIPPVIKYERRISEKTKFFYEAFHEETIAELSHEFVRESIDILEDIQDDRIPFYFDHFLRLNNYEPEYNFKTEIEQRDGPEEQYMNNKFLLKETLLKLEQWEEKEKVIMEQNIKNNPQMYVNVKT